MNESRLPARQIEDWPPHLERRLLHAFQREDFEAFLHRAFCVINPGQEYTRSWHISAIAHKLDKVRLGESKRLIIAMPPRHLKSITVSIAFPAFLLGHDPSMRIIGASYADSLAAAHSNDFRRLIESQPYKRLFPKTRIDPAKNTEAEVRTTQRGFRLATSVGGSLTGRGGQLIIIDDPLKPDEAASATARRRAIDWYEKTVTSRLDHKGEGAIILVMQRLHVDDLAGHLLEGGGWDYLGLPAIADIEEAIPLTRGRVYIRRPGELLFPARESMTVLDQLKREMGSYAFSAQYQQEPVPLGGGLIQWAWFRFYDEDNLPRYPAEEIVISSAGMLWIKRNAEIRNEPEKQVAPDRETLVGSVERVTFHNADTGFAVLKVKARGRRDLVPVVGHAASIGAGEYIHAVGTWLTDRTHGLQFKADVLKTTPPTTSEGMARYLGSGMVRGIGAKLAERIVGQFGLDTFEIIEADPSRLLEVSGIGDFRAGRIAAGWAEQKAVRDIMVFLHSHGVSTSRAVRIFKTYGHDAIAVMTEDPYRLARDIRGIGFRSADAIAIRLGLTKESPKRLRAGVSFALQTATDDGHCALPVDELVGLAEKLLEVPSEPIRTAIDAELADGKVVLDRIENQSCLFLKGLHAAERDIAERLRSLARGDLPWPQIEVERAIPWVEQRTGKILSTSQRKAVDLVLHSKLSVVTGGPGVGKTTLLDTILSILSAKGVRLLLAAPTGRAAKRMSEQTGIEAKTIHRLLDVDPKNGGFKKGLNDPLDCDLLVIDETSMVDVPLMNAITKAVRSRAGLLLVGDVDQLPSVGPGRVLADVIDSEAVAVARLTEVFRQAAESRIVVNAHRINRGEFPERLRPGSNSDFYFVECNDPDDGARKIVEIVRDRLPRRFGLDSIRDVQVLCPMQRGSMGARALNADLQKALNPNPSSRVERFGSVFLPGDKVMQTENDYNKEVFNGDLGTVVKIDEEEGVLLASFDGRDVEYAFGELDTLIPAYATTVHKSQGSEYPAVVIALAMQHYNMLARNLLYTAVTRGKQLVILVGQRRALAIAVRTSNARRRWTKLDEWLAA